MNYSESFIKACEKLGKRIQNLREEKQITIKEMSEQTGIRKEYLKKIEQGKAYGVALDKHLIKIANVLQIKMSILLDL